MTRKFLSCCLMAASFTTFGNESNYLPYVIKRGDNVSQVLSDYSKYPLYGPDQWVEKVLKLNRLTYDSSKQLRPGDVIVLPVKSKVFENDQYEDEVKTLESSWEKQLETEYLAPKKYNFLFLGTYFHRNIDFKSEEVDVDQSFQAYIEYKQREIDSDNRISYNTIFSLAGYTQSNADFSSDTDLVAEFTPSAILTAQFEIEDRESQFSLTLIGAYESLSTVEQINNSYDVTRKSIFWGGAEVSRYFYTGQNTYQLGVSAFIGSDFDASRYIARLRGFIKQHYVAEIFFTQTEFDFTESSSIRDIGISIGYRF